VLHSAGTIDRTSHRTTAKQQALVHFSPTAHGPLAGVEPLLRGHRVHATAVSAVSPGRQPSRFGIRCGLAAYAIVHLLSKVLSPFAEAFRYPVIERGETHLWRTTRRCC